MRQNTRIMNNPYCLPTSLTIGGKEYELRTDFRAILDILRLSEEGALDDEEDLSPWEKDSVRVQATFMIAFPQWKQIPPEDYTQALQKLYAFIDCGINGEGEKKPPLMSWSADAPLLIPAVNAVAGKEVRALPYLHWWTFLGYYMEIGESLFSQVLNIRRKKAEHKKLDEWENKFYKENKTLVDQGRKKRRRTPEEQAALEELFGTSSHQGK